MAQVIASPVHVVAAQSPDTVEFWQMFNDGFCLHRFDESGVPVAPVLVALPVGIEPVEVVPVEEVVPPVVVVVAPVVVVVAPVVVAPVVVVVEPPVVVVEPPLVVVEPVDEPDEVPVVEPEEVPVVEPDEVPVVELVELVEPVVELVPVPVGSPVLVVVPPELEPELVPVPVEAPVVVVEVDVVLGGGGSAGHMLAKSA